MGNDILQEVAVDTGLRPLDESANVAAPRHPDSGLAQAPGACEDQQEAEPHTVAALVDPDLGRDPRCSASDLDDAVRFAVNEQHLRAGVGQAAVVGTCVGHAFIPALAHFVATGLRNRVADLPELPHERVALVVPRQPQEDFPFFLGHDGPDFGEPLGVALVEVVACGGLDRGRGAVLPLGFLRPSCRGQDGPASKAAKDAHHDEAVQSASKPVAHHAAAGRVTAGERTSLNAGGAFRGLGSPP